MQLDNRWLVLLLCVCSVCVKCTVSNILLSFAQNFLESKVLPTEFQRLDRILQGLLLRGPSQQTCAKPFACAVFGDDLSFKIPTGQNQVNRMLGALLDCKVLL